MFLTGLSADLHSTAWYSTSTRRASTPAIATILEQTFVVARCELPGHLDVRVRRLAYRFALAQTPPGAGQGRRAEVVEDALLATRPARVADAAAMKDQA